MNEALLPKTEGRILHLGLEAPTWRVVVEELLRVSYVSLPFMAVAVSQHLLQAISVIMAGHFGKHSLSGAAITTFFFNVTGFSLLSGFASALETLCGQAYGAMQYEKIGNYTYSSMISMLPICLPVCLLWVFMDKLLVLMELNPQISSVACRYGLWLIPALFAYAILQSQVRYFQSQSLIFPILFVSWTTLCFHIPVCWILVYKSGLGYTGAALAISLSYWLNVILLGFYMRYSSSCEKTRAFFLTDVFLSIREFFYFAVPSALMICLEFCSFQSLIVLVGLLPNSKVETSVLAVCFASISLHYYIPFGISAATSICVSNELGAGNPQAARRATRVAMALTLAESVVTSITLFCCQVFGNLYSNKKDAANNLTEMVPLICLSIITDSFHVVLNGIIRGIGLQHIGVYANLGAYYFVGIPVGILCGFVLQLRGAGLWIGMLTGCTVQIILLSLVVIFTDWEKKAINARERKFVGEMFG